MMLDIIKKVKTNSFLIVFLSFLAIGCKEKEKGDYEIVYYTNTSKGAFHSNFYINEQSAVFLYVDENTRDKIENEEIKKIEIKTNSRNYTALPIDLFFSRERPNSDFVYTVDNKTKKVIFEDINNNSYIIIISEKIFIEDLVEKKGIKVKPLPAD